MRALPGLLRLDVATCFESRGRRKGGRDVSGDVGHSMALQDRPEIIGESSTLSVTHGPIRIQTDRQTELQMIGDAGDGMPQQILILQNAPECIRGVGVDIVDQATKRILPTNQ